MSKNLQMLSLVGLTVIVLMASALLIMTGTQPLEKQQQLAQKVEQEAQKIIHNAEEGDLIFAANVKQRKFLMFEVSGRSGSGLQLYGVRYTLPTKEHMTFREIVDAMGDDADGIAVLIRSSVVEKALATMCNAISVFKK
jgi:hypothetical protein